MANNDGGEGGLTVRRVRIDTLHADPANVNRHPDANLRHISDSLKTFGQVEPLVVQKGTGKVIGGNGRLQVLIGLGVTEVDVVELDIDDTKAAALGIAPNRSAKSSEFDDGALAAVLATLPSELQLGAGFDMSDLRELESSLDKPVVEDGPPAPLPEPVSKRGDIWTLGTHRMMCGDSTSPSDSVLACDGLCIDCILTDPPYCSGGFQEAGRAAGSVGTDGDHVPIANDRLSTRGFSALLKSAFGNVESKYIYAFTDWRMWVHLFDIAESCGFRVRSMIVWDKGTPGMGRGWRCQHELILWGCRATAPFDKHASGQGNVLSVKRSGNEHHTTEKPVMLIGPLLATTPFIESVYDPFSGSGTTLIACEQLGRNFRGVELDPRYVDTAIRRWQKLTGKDATLDGKAWKDVAAERGVKID